MAAICGLPPVSCGGDNNDCHYWGVGPGDNLASRQMLNLIKNGAVVMKCINTGTKAI